MKPPRTSDHCDTAPARRGWPFDLRCDVLDQGERRRLARDGEMDVPRDLVEGAHVENRAFRPETRELRDRVASG
ncbi:MAG TPA: hypothetical protein VHE30_14230 [Polyangiaceae bacterium]|nr:hypothetical protein [Polyangiaceae bacterium]